MRYAFSARQRCMVIPAACATACLSLVRHDIVDRVRRVGNSGPTALHTSHAADPDVDAHGEPESCLSIDDPPWIESQFAVTADALPPLALLLFMKQVVDGDSIFAVLEKAGQNSTVVAADGDKPVIALQGLGDVIAKRRGKHARSEE